MLFKVEIFLRSLFNTMRDWVVFFVRHWYNMPAIIIFFLIQVACRPVSSIFYIWFLGQFFYKFFIKGIRGFIEVGYFCWSGVWSLFPLIIYSYPKIRAMRVVERLRERLLNKNRGVVNYVQLFLQVLFVCVLYIFSIP